MSIRNKLFSLPVLLAVLVAAVLFMQFRNTAPLAQAIPYSEFMRKAQLGELKAVEIKGDKAVAALKGGVLVETVVPPDMAFADSLAANKVVVSAKPATESSLFMTLLMTWAPTFLLIGVFVYLSRKNGAAKPNGRDIFSVGKAKTKMAAAGTTQVTLADVAGCDEAKEEVAEMVDFLRNPKKFEALGASIPRGVLMAGPPGTGKTLLAKAIAGEAGVPFFTISGSDFVEMFVGVGAARVRDLFKQAKAQAPCIVFIDEIDAVGRHRGAGHGGGSDEREQTLNQMLVEMDGFEPNQGIIVIAATNRPDVLDTALLRPGRFDRQVMVGLPDVRGREQILKVHARKVPLAPTVDLTAVARGTPGFSGAELANLINESALLSARADLAVITPEMIDRAKDKIIMGPERRSMRMSEKERSDTAFHEAGHAIIAKLLEHTDPVHKVSIMPRGRALGVTVQLPDSERYSMGRKRILDTIAVLFGGRVAEEVFTDDVTTGASNDYERATQLARQMVLEWGMGEAMGQMVLNKREGLSEQMLLSADTEIRELLDAQYQRVTTLLLANKDKMVAMHNALMEWETLDARQVEDIMQGRQPRPPVTPTPSGIPESLRSPTTATVRGTLANA
jgi:cell division protease FtsH